MEGGIHEGRDREKDRGVAKDMYRRNERVDGGERQGEG